MTVFGYARKDFPSQIAVQLNKLMGYNCEKVFVENMSFDDETEFSQALIELKSDDTLVVDSLSVFGKRLKKLTELIGILTERQIRLISVSDGFDSTEEYQFSMIAQTLCQVDSVCQSQYTKERLAIVKRTGKHLGRPTIDQKIIIQIQQLYHHHKLNYREISEQCGVSLGSVHKYINYELESESQ